MRNGLNITASTFGSGKGGNIIIEAGNMLLSGNKDDLTGVTSFAGSGAGDAGDVTIATNDRLTSRLKPLLQCKNILDS